jgi:hypothetical protein
VVVFYGDMRLQPNALVHLDPSDSERPIVGSSGPESSQAREIEGRHGLAVLVFASDKFSQPFLFQPLREHDEEVGQNRAVAVGSSFFASLVP